MKSQGIIPSMPLLARAPKANREASAQVALPSSRPLQSIPGNTAGSQRAQDTRPAASLDALANYNKSLLQLKFQGNPTLGRFPFDQVDIRLGDHPDNPYLNTLHDWMVKIWDSATRPRPGFPDGWIQPMDTLFQMSNQIDLMEAAARGGFPTRYRHWTWGQDFNDQYQRQRWGLGRLYEMVINTNPSYAFLYDRNPVHAQKLVMAHVFGHTDFFRNNHMFSETNRNMVRVMADHKSKVEQYYQDPRLSRKTADGVHPVEDFINKFDAIEWLVDLNALTPPPLESEGPPEEDIANQDFNQVGVKPDLLGAAPWMQDFLYPKEEWHQYRDKIINESDETDAKILKRPTRDITGFLIEHSTALKPWQRDLLKTLREEQYYFVPQIRTKLMNEGWATFWHHKLMTEPEIADPAETADLAIMMAGVESPNPNGINPYQVGYAIFQNIFLKAAYHLEDFDNTFEPNKVLRWEDIMKRFEGQPPDEEAGLKKVLEVRKWYNDIEFIKQFFTPDVAAQLGMVITREREDWDRDTWQRVKVRYVESDDFNQVKNMILSYYQNAFPTVNLVDANHNGNGELLMKHENNHQDLDLKDTKATLVSLFEMWGRPVHLDTMFEVEEPQPNQRHRYPYGRSMYEYEYEQPPKFSRKPVRLSYNGNKMEIFTLTPEGKPEKNITSLYF